jgi:ParB family transcriptional regulator, chromosome partitioning protein
MVVAMLNPVTLPPATASELRAIDDIKVGKRHRQDLGDIEALANSIAATGLLHPITVDATGNLLAGARRLAACKQLGWSEIPVRVVRT